MPIYSQKKISRVFSPKIRFEIFPETCIFTYKRQRKYRTHMFIQDHTVIWAIRVRRILCCRQVQETLMLLRTSIMHLNTELAYTIQSRALTSILTKYQYTYQVSVY